MSPLSIVPWLAALLTSASLLAWTVIVFERGWFWRTDRSLDLAGPTSGPDAWPRVHAVVPARNEARVLPQTLPMLLVQDYPGELRLKRC